MGITVTIAATSTSLTTLDAVKRDLGLTTADDDLVLEAMIARASSAISRETRRTFGAETVTETLDGSGSRLLSLARTPIIGISSITEDGTTVSASEYNIEDAEAGAVYRLNGWGRASGLRMWGTEAYASGYILPGYRDLRYSVTYQAGYVLPGEASPTLPGAVERACIETVKSWYFARDVDPALTSIQSGQLRVAYKGNDTSSTPPGSLPASALGLLRNYYRMTG